MPVSILTILFQPYFFSLLYFLSSELKSDFSILMKITLRPCETLGLGRKATPRVLAPFVFQKNFKGSLRKIFKGFKSGWALTYEALNVWTLAISLHF